MRILLLVAIGMATAYGAEMSKVEWGKYLAEEVAKCQLCHTPTDDKGDLDAGKNMKGKVQTVQPIDEIKGWHKTSPDITPDSRKWKQWGGEAAMVKFLTTGLAPNGKPADPPMPAYKLKQADAEAIVEYLKTLK